MSEPVAATVDVAFTLEGAALPREHRALLADALEQVAPWLALAPGAGVHGLKLPEGGDGESVPLPRRARLLLRVPRELAARLGRLAGEVLVVGAHRVRLGPWVQRELLPHRTLYAHFVASAGRDELAFLDDVDAELHAMGVRCLRICGRARELRDGAQRIAGFGLMLDALTPEASLQVQDVGLGAHRRLGCGLFVPHRSAAAVGG